MWEFSRINSFIFSYYKNNQTKLILHTCTALVLSYILVPTFKSCLEYILINKKLDNNQESKREDKYTTGLINSSTYCFINSSLQALSSLPKFTIYLNETLKITYGFIQNNHLSSNIERSKISPLDDYGSLRQIIPLHIAVSEFLFDLQKIVTKPTSTSVRQLIKVLEVSVHLKFNNGQQDAHEITQILLETLKNENKVLDQTFKKSGESQMVVPEFPFLGCQTDSLICLTCNRTSNVREHEFIILTLHLPRIQSDTLLNTINKNQVEEITDYACLVCQINSILANEEYLKRNNNGKTINAEESRYIDTLRQLVPKICINEELPDDVIYYIKSYNKNGLNVCQKIRSKIIKKTVITKAPLALILHLSRSSYNGMISVRNSCNIAYDSKLELQSQSITDNICSDIVNNKYSLQAMVKHTGTHMEGHYQCYRKKPNLVKRISYEQNGNDIIKKYDIINRTPVIQLKLDVDNNMQQRTIGVLESKTKKLNSIKSKPYWKISDTDISEVTENQVINESKYVYMLYYDLAS
ncbi:hypothetical protein TPHA_0L01670 [Tetrapisispora phaffii CBS 4417]|uniref:USP domain-containing protein n=1 Tax=Tetrapisispora phaffii (strain ATCC 24235 / CBS 4417 / NBRC 1672 / NRRL Y-8282 / UCD 70-5) TaxID=1071381 RepID=G8C042_TETPH|nr:hypothetical protein TPHA_0L01670 [Tetrapisispora phaffii CBS 4417]CCE65520.1 hypothetical protein TPHA_0L01670 [Tetrapisispora phaffii CBS 4417]